MFLNFMLKKGIVLQQHYIPIFFFKKIYKGLFSKKYFSGALEYYNKSISLPIHLELSYKNLKYIVYQIDKYFSK